MSVVCQWGRFDVLCLNLWMTSKLETMGEWVVCVCVWRGRVVVIVKKEWQRDGGGALVVGRAVSWQESSWGGGGEGG